MKYHLTEQQYDTLWQDSRYSISHWEFALRVVEFSDRFGNKIKYTEGIDSNSVNYWGCLEGDEKQINWFLLNL